MKPLLHIGYHKTGSTFLQKRVFPEPGFALVARAKVLKPAFVEGDPFGFDARIALEIFRPGIEKAQKEGLVPVLSAERLSGNPHSGGYDSKQIAERLVATFPEARVLLVIREQAQMLVSAYKQYIKRGGPGTIKQYAKPPSEEPRVPLFNFRFFEYHRLISYYQSLFGAENVQVLPYELLKASPRAFLERIGAFAETNVSSSDSEPVKVSPSALSLSLKRQANRWVVRSDLNPAPLFGIDGANRALLRLCYKADARMPAGLSVRGERQLRDLAEELVDGRYAKSNATTARLTGLDLEVFGYACK